MRYATTLLSSLILILLLGLASASFGSTLIMSQDCEDTSFSDYFLERTHGTTSSDYWAELTSEVTRSTTAHGGSYSMTYDPWVTGNPHAVVGYGPMTYGNTSDLDLDDYNNRYWYFRWYQRWESGATYDGYNKILYMNYNGQGDLVFAIQKGSSTGFHIEVYDSGYTLVDNLYPHHTSSLDDETWHKMEFFIDFGTGSSDAHYWINIDDVALVDHDQSDSDWDDNTAAARSTTPIQYLTGWPSNTSAYSGSQQTWIDDQEIYTLTDETDIPGEDPTYCSDADNDGYYLAGSCYTASTDPGGDYELYSTFSGEDCDDTDGTLTDNCTSTTITCYKDTDGDGYSDGTSETVTTCSTGYYESGDLTATSGDCDDTSATYTPASSDPCYDCDSETACVSYTYYYDPDGDGYGDGTSQTATIDPGSYWYLESELTATTGDCDNDDALYTPASSDPCYDCNASTLCGGGGSFSGSEGSMNFTGSGVLNIQ